MRSKVYDQLRAGYEAESRKLAESLLKDGPDHLVSAFVAENTDRLMKVELLSEANGLYFKQLAKIRKLKKAIHKQDELIRELVSFIRKTSEAANDGETIGAGWFLKCDELIAKAREVVK